MTTRPQPVPRPMVSPMPFQRYRSHRPLDLPDRTWPSQSITKAPRWLSTDLRDGNQALIDPMTPRRKRKLFDLLVRIGFKEIEIGFPSASQTDFDFVRSLIEDETAIPDDVTISVLTQARPDLIDRTAESLVGAKRASIHLYNATAELFRRVVFGLDESQTMTLAQQGTQWVIEAAQKWIPEVEFGFEYSPEVFSQTPTDFALAVCEAVMDVWQPDQDRQIILNLPATVEAGTPNTYADQVEYFCRQISRRQAVCISLHPHNDRGTAVAAAEFGLLAGGQRVEGCLFGHGERTGNVDLVTMALNLYSQGVDPALDFSDLDEVRRSVEYCTGMPVLARQPYAGDLVYTAFSGSHQDAIKKGLEALEKQAKSDGIGLHEIDWQVPYLSVDPDDLGRSYEAVIRVNSQSGKGGMAYLMKTDHKLDLPRRLQIEFSRVVQSQSDSQGGEISSEALWQLFASEYLNHSADWTLISQTTTTIDRTTTMVASLEHNGHAIEARGEGNGPVSAFVDALGGLGVKIRVLDYFEHALTSGDDAQAVAYVEAEIGDETAPPVLWGVGIDADITVASLKAVLSAVNRH